MYNTILVILLCINCSPAFQAGNNLIYTLGYNARSLNWYNIMYQFHAYADGRVQGVNFRYYVQRKAGELNLSGYVRNLPDGKVEILAQGAKEDLEKLITYIKSNPGISFVTELKIDWEEPKGKFEGFKIRF